MKPLAPQALYRACDPAALPFATTAELPDTDDPVGQDRAVEAIRFAIGMRHRGFNLFALGPEGTGRRSLVMRFLAQAAAEEPVPDDWAFVADFDDPHKPRALRLPSGRAGAFRHDMEELVEELGIALPAAFEADDYRARRQTIEDEFKRTQDEAFEEIRAEAKTINVDVERTPVGLALSPTDAEGNTLTPEQFHALPEDEQATAKQHMETLHERLQKMLKQVPLWERETRVRLRELEQEVVTYAIAHLMEELTAKYVDLPEIIAYLDQVAEDVADHAGAFLDDDDDDDGRPRPSRQVEDESEAVLRRYRVNVLVDRAGAKGAPVVFEDHPTQPNLIGRIEHQALYGALVTDFNLIKAGSLHRANGGYLVMDAHKLLMQPYAWEDLKRALKARRITIESPGQSVGLWSTVTLDPEPIPLDVKVVLIGDSELYYLLSHHDPEFAELFKVSADFDWRMERNETNVMGIARSAATLTRKEDLRPLDRAAVARLVEQASRDVEDSERLSAHMASLADLVREADYWAGEECAPLVGAHHVQKAIDASIRRQDRVRERVQEEILGGIVRIDTDGLEVGQINGLSVLQLGRFAFGRPTRITARVRFGKGEVVDIEREAELGGPLHGKGVLILSSFLSSHFATEGPLSLDATLAFEQSYGGIEGDSASSTELYALLSALADVPIRQWLAVTGSVDQFGRVQAIGGVNEKIEGFFDLCAARGLAGHQGVLIPATNVRHLMLRQDVVLACAEGRFHVWPVETVEQGIELLTGMAAGQRDGRGQFPPGTIYRKVEARLQAFARRAESLLRPSAQER